MTKAIFLCAAMLIAVTAKATHAQPRLCPPVRKVVDIRGTTDPSIRKSDLGLLKNALATDNTIVRLGPNVDLNFSGLKASFFPIHFGRCVTLTSVASFHNVVRTALAPRIRLVGPIWGTEASEARTPRTPGPVLRYSKHLKGVSQFMTIDCVPNGAMNDNDSISGFRLYGPSFGIQKTNEIGIHIVRCVHIEISNMEIAGWGGAGIAVDDTPGPDQDPSSNVPGGRISDPRQILIHGNFIHNNEHPSSGGHAEGYGVVTGPGAWAKIYQNVFDFNRHDIAANGRTGGYWAERNLVLKGGGYNSANNPFNPYTHSFDAHGTENCPPFIGGLWNCGAAGVRFWIENNAWQYTTDNDIKVRGTPLRGVYIAANVFPSDRGKAINLYTTDNATITSNNVYDLDTFGNYGVCDFDGDGLDDLFLATGESWWFSSAGKFPWSYLNAKTERLKDLRFGYFDDDLRCDVLADHNGEWVISSGGTGDWKPLGRFGVPLSQVHFGRFDPSVRDHRPDATRKTTHAFWRRSDGQWFVTPLSHPDWQRVGSSRLPMSKLRFGDFTGDGVTDVLAVVHGHWAISDSARGRWRTLNAHLGYPVDKVFIANMDPDDNIDDILVLSVSIQKLGVQRHAKLTWWRSKNGRTPWQKWTSYVFNYRTDAPYVVPMGFGFAGRFGVIPGGGTMVISPSRRGQFYSAAEKKRGGSPSWTSLFPY